MHHGKMGCRSVAVVIHDRVEPLARPATSALLQSPTAMVKPLKLMRRVTRGTHALQLREAEKAADLPVQSPTKYELAINLKTAKAHGLTMPPSLLARADQVIE